MDTLVKCYAWANDVHWADRKPLSEVLLELPNWMLAEVQHDTLSTQEILVFLCVVHSKCWIDTRFSPEEMTEMCTSMLTAMILELHRRQGLVRFSVEGDDNILPKTNDKLTIELNPALTDMVTGENVEEILSTPERMDDLVKVASATDWVDHEALARD